jgi:hypothetical protein
MKYAEDYGLDKVLKEIEEFRSLNNDMWPRSSYLEKIAKEEKKFN